MLLILMISIKRSFLAKKNYMDKSSFKYSDFDELISDKGVSYNTNNYKNYSEDNLF